MPVLFWVHSMMHLPLYPLLPSSCLSAKNSEHTFHMHSWLSLRNMERLQQRFCLTGLGHWWDGWLPLSRQHQQLLLMFFFFFFIHLEDPPSLCCYICICFIVFHVFICARSEFSAPLCRWRNLQGENHQRAIVLLGYKLFACSEGTLILLISMSTLTAGTRATQTCHCLSSTDIQAF